VQPQNKQNLRLAESRYQMTHVIYFLNSKIFNRKLTFICSFFHTKQAFKALSITDLSREINSRNLQQHTELRKYRRYIMMGLIEKIPTQVNLLNIGVIS
jgi:hypothetical protein